MAVYQKKQSSPDRRLSSTQACAFQSKENMKKYANLSVIPLLATLVLSGCTTYRDIGVQHQSAGLAGYQTLPPLWKGDHVRYALKDGQKGETVIQSLNSRYLKGQDGAQVPLEQVVRLERKEVSGGKTAAATGAGIGVGAIVVVTVLSVGLATALIAAGS